MPGSDQSEVLKRLVKSVIAYGRAYIIRHCLHVGVAIVHAYAVAHSLKHLLVVHAVAKAYCVGNYILAQNEDINTVKHYNGQLSQSGTIPLCDWLSYSALIKQQEN